MREKETAKRIKEFLKRLEFDAFKKDITDTIDNIVEAGNRAIKKTGGM